MTYDLYQLSKVRGKDGALKQGINEGKRRRSSTATSPNQERKAIEDVFISSLVAAGECRQHAASRHNTSSWWSTRPIRQSRCSRIPKMGCRRHFTNRPSTKQMPALAALEEQGQVELTKDDYLDLVSAYDSPAFLEDAMKPLFRTRKQLKAEQAEKDKQAAEAQEAKQIEHYPLAPRLVISPEKEDMPPYAPRVVIPPQDKEHQKQLRHFHHLLCYQFGYISLPKLWDFYQSLRAPRARYLSDSQIRRFFRHLAWVEFKNDDDAMRRYHALLEDCLGGNIAVTQSEWNTAISFAGRWVRNSTTAEVKQAVELWMRMESHDVQADAVTFNILFETAVRAGRFALADTIHHELHARGLTLDRYFRTSMIYTAGLRGNGNAVRRAFHDLVNADELVDTAVMNCVILSLVRAGEPSAAEGVYAKMRRLQRNKTAGVPTPRPWQESKAMGKTLNKTAKILRQERENQRVTFFGSNTSADDRREEVQKMVPIAPNARTYRILIQHHAYTSGNMDQILLLLAEMKADDWRVHGSVFVHIFRGFWQHGGMLITAWDRKRLEAFWAEFLAISDSHNADDQPKNEVDEVDDYASESSETDRSPYFHPALAIAAVRAFYKCAGKKRMLEVWEEIHGRWPDMNTEEASLVQSSIDRMCTQDSIYV